jgi:hypothetical protein
VSGLWDEPRGRHLYGVDHHHCVADAAVLLIELEFLLAASAGVNPAPHHLDALLACMPRLSVSVRSITRLVDDRGHLGTQQLDTAQHLLVRESPDTYVQLEAIDPQDLLPAQDLGSYGLYVAEHQ